MFKRFQNKAISLDGFVFSKNTDGTLSIESYTGAASTLLIPEKVKRRTVTRINSNAFQNCPDLKHIKIPSCIIYIASDAFKKDDVPQKETRMDPDLSRAFTATCRRDLEYMFGYDYMSIESKMIGIELGVTDPTPRSSYSIKATVAKGSYAEKYCKENDIEITRYL